MRQPASADTWQRREEQREAHTQKHQQAELDLYMDPPEAYDPECACIQIDCDLMNVANCPVHGAAELEARRRAAEAAEQIAYYSQDFDLPERKPVRNAQVAEPLRSIINAFGVK